MKDFLGKELSIGDSVVVTPKNYRGLVKAQVISFTAKQVRLEYMNTWNFQSRPEQYLVYANCCVKIDV